MKQQKELTVKYNVTYFTANEDDEPHEAVFTYLGMPAHIAKRYAMDAAEAYSIDNTFTSFEIQQMKIN